MTRSLLALLVLLSACQRPPPAPEPAPAPAPAPERPATGPDGAAPAAPPAADPGPGPVPLTRATAALADESLDVLLGKDGETEVQPAARFQVDVAAPLADARLVLLDPQEALVPAETVAEIRTADSRFRLVPARPLRPGARYALRLEGSGGREIHDLVGRAYRPISMAVRAAGEPPREPKRPAKKRRRRS